MAKRSISNRRQSGLIKRLYIGVINAAIEVGACRLVPAAKLSSMAGLLAPREMGQALERSARHASRMPEIIKLVARRSA